MVGSQPYRDRLRQYIRSGCMECQVMRKSKQIERDEAYNPCIAGNFVQFGVDHTERKKS